MKQSERDKLTSFLTQKDVLSTYKYWLENYGAIKNFYVFCDNVPAEMAFRSAFAWNAEPLVKGANAEKYWEYLNTRWIDCLTDVKEVKVNDDHKKIEALKEVFRCYHMPGNPRKFGGKIGASEQDVRLAMEELLRERRQQRLYEEETAEEEVKEQAAEEKEQPKVDYDWAQLTPISVGGRTVKDNDYPTGRKMRVKMKKSRLYMILFSPEVSNELTKVGCGESMDMAVDNLNRLVFVFGKDKKYKASQYMKDGSLSVQNKAIIQTLEKYLQTTFEMEKSYYVELGKQHYSEATKQVAIVVSNSITENK